jgi:hypothetical protein
VHARGGVAGVERQQGMAEPALQHCPTCSGAVRRLISGGTGFIVKGGVGPAHGCADGGPRCCGREERCDRPPCGDASR